MKGPPRRKKPSPPARDKKNPFKEIAILDVLMEHMPDCIYLKDVQGRFIRVSRSVARRLGRTNPSEVLGKTDFDFFTKDHAQAACVDEQEVLRTGQPLIGKEERETWPDQPDTWVSTTKIPFQDGEGRIVGVLGITRDITTRKTAEELLQKGRAELQMRVNEQTAQLSAQNATLQKEALERNRAEEGLLREKRLLDAFMENIPDAIYVKDRESRFVRVNRAFTLKHGLSNPSDAIGKSDSDFFDPEFARLTYEKEQEIMSSGQPMIGVETREVWPGKPESWALCSKVPCYDSMGNVAGLIGISRDITGQRRAKEDLLSQKSLLDALMDNIPDAIYFKDKQSRFIRMNESHARKHDLKDPSEAVGKSDFDFFGIEHAQAAFDDEQIVIRTGQPLLSGH